MTFAEGLMLFDRVLLKVVLENRRLVMELKKMRRITK
jgi:hypothetical protein